MTIDRAISKFLQMMKMIAMFTIKKVVQSRVVVSCCLHIYIYIYIYCFFDYLLFQYVFQHTLARTISQDF